MESLVEKTARTSYGKLLAVLTKLSGGDVALAEDALSEAFVKALTNWGDKPPANPEGWLVTTARNSIIDRFRHLKVKANHLEELLDQIQHRGEYRDERLSLLFVCAHPAIDSAIHTPLMLQTVLGLSIEQIAAAFILSPSALEKRLVRAKNKIREAGIPFEVPSPEELPERLSGVLDSVYAAFGTSWNELEASLEEEAVYLARLIVKLLPEEPEAKGLLSLMLYARSRKSARRRGESFVPLEEQDSSLWNPADVNEAEEFLRTAFSASKIGRYQLEAAIQSAHVERILHEKQNFSEVLSLYRHLLLIAPSIGAWIAAAAAYLRAGLSDEARGILEGLDPEEVKTYQPYWVTLAELKSVLGQRIDAEASARRAIALTTDAAVKNWLRNKFQLS